MTNQPPNSGAPSQPGMTGSQAADASQAMLESARAQKDQIAQGFMAERDAVLQAVAQTQASVPKPEEMQGFSAAEATKAAQAAGYSPEEIETALRIMNENAGIGAAAPAAAPQAAPQPQQAPPQTASMTPRYPQMAPMDPSQEILQRLQLMIATEVAMQLRAHGIGVPASPPAAPPAPSAHPAPQAGTMPPQQTPSETTQPVQEQAAAPLPQPIQPTTSEAEKNPEKTSENPSQTTS